MRKTILNAIAMLMLSGGAAAQTVEAQQAPTEEATEPFFWAQVTGGYDILRNSMSLRAEGEAIIPAGPGAVDIYGMLNLDAAEDSADLEDHSAEIFASYVVNGVGPLAHYQSFSGLEDVVRFGVMANPEIDENTIIKAWFTPANTQGANAQVGAFASRKQELGSGVNLVMDAFAEYNFDYEGNTNDLYFEAGAYLNPIAGLQIGNQTRGLLDFENDFEDLRNLMVLRYEF